MHVCMHACIHLGLCFAGIVKSVIPSLFSYSLWQFDIYAHTRASSMIHMHTCRDKEINQERNIHAHTHKHTRTHTHYKYEIIKNKACTRTHAHTNAHKDTYIHTYLHAYIHRRGSISFDDDEDPNLSKLRSAVKLQSVYRGHICRKIVKHMVCAPVCVYCSLRV